MNLKFHEDTKDLKIITPDSILKGDCLELMALIPDKSVDMVLCDLPYGTVGLSWDVVIPFWEHIYIDKKVFYLEDIIKRALKLKLSVEKEIENFKASCKQGLWNHYLRIGKEKAAFVLTGSQPFTSMLGASNIQMLKYSWIWKKSLVTGHMNAKKMPLKNFEDILVFYEGLPTYNPQGVIECNLVRNNSNDEVIGDNLVKNSTTKGLKTKEYAQTQTNYPKNILEFQNPLGGIHPTQKPTELFEYLISTYSNVGDVILDTCLGSGTTAIACINTGRKCIGMEIDPEFFKKIKNRIYTHIPPFEGLRF